MIKTITFTFFLFSTISTVVAQIFGTQEMIEYENLSLNIWEESNIKNYAGTYSFGESEAETSFHLYVSNHIICAQLEKGDWANTDGEIVGWHYTYENYTNVKIEGSHFYADQSNGEFVEFNRNNRTYKGLKLYKPPVQMGNNGEYEIGTFYEHEKIGKYFDTKTEILSTAYLEKLNNKELKLMRNEIFARYHYLFKTKTMSDYFNELAWYTGYHHNVDSFLNEIEKENIKNIRKIELKKSK